MQATPKAIQNCLQSPQHHASSAIILLLVTVTAGANKQQELRSAPIACPQQPLRQLKSLACANHTLTSGLTRTAWRPGSNHACGPHRVLPPHCHALVQVASRTAHARSMRAGHRQNAHAGAMQGAITRTPSYDGAGCAPGRTCRAPAARTWAATPEDTSTADPAKDCLTKKRQACFTAPTKEKKHIIALHTS